MEIKADPDLNLGEYTLIALGGTPDAGHKVYLYPKANPADETPRIGLDFAEISPLYSEEVDATGVSVPAKADDLYFMVEIDEKIP